MDKIRCLRCKAQMEGPFREEFQLGKQGILGGSLSHLMAGSLEVDLYYCPDCRKLEFYLPSSEDTAVKQTSEEPDMECPDCGLHLDPGQKVCPCCGYQFSFR